MVAMNDLKSNENAWRWKGLPSIRKQWVGNGEAVLSLVCLVSLFLFCSPPGHLTRESQIPWMLFVILGLGIGLSVGGMRFGSLPGYLIGILSLVIQLLILALLVLYTNFV